MKARKGKPKLSQFGLDSALIFHDWWMENAEALQAQYQLAHIPGTKPLVTAAVLAPYPPEACPKRASFLEPYWDKSLPLPPYGDLLEVAYLRYANPDLVPGLRQFLYHRVAYVHGNLNAVLTSKVPKWLGIPCRTVCCFERPALLALFAFLGIHDQEDIRRSLGTPVYRWPTRRDAPVTRPRWRIEWASEPLSPTPANKQQPLAVWMPLTAHDAARSRRNK